MSATPDDLPYKTPPFNPGSYTAKTFAWWHWHPANVKDVADGWRRTCWEAPTEERAMDLIPQLSHICHHKLVAEGFGDLLVVHDLPPQDPDQWLRYKAEIGKNANLTNVSA